MNSDTRRVRKYCSENALKFPEIRRRIPAASALDLKAKISKKNCLVSAETNICPLISVFIQPNDCAINAHFNVTFRATLV